ncbi:MAG TPA: mobilization protein [Thiomonas arsenitoxydans]|nr:mobilization protein [Thiomonas arsenitoxydans]
MRERTVHLALRATPEEAALIRHLADAALLSVSAFLRITALRGDVCLPRLQSLQAELRRQGGLLKHLTTQGAVPPAAAAQALADWRAAVQRIAEVTRAGQGHCP